MIITKEVLELGKSDLGGWNRSQTSLLGVPWPLISGWKRRLLGVEVPDELVLKFYELKNAHLNQTEGRQVSEVKKPPCQGTIVREKGTRLSIWNAKTKAREIVTVDRIILKAGKVGDLNSVEIDLLDLIKWLKQNKPKLLK